MSAGARAAVERVLGVLTPSPGPWRLRREASEAHGVNRVFELELEHDRAWLKLHGQRRKYDQELAAYRDWLAPLAARTPRLVARHDGERALLLTDLGGTPLHDVTDPRADLELHRQAGAFLAALHARAFTDPDPLPLARALPRRLEAWLARVELPGELVTTARRLVGDGEVLAGAPRVPCHRDYQPRNWRARPGPDLGVLDFEHARGDHPWADLVKLWDGPWVERPARRTAFLEGYGRELGPEDERALLALAAVHGVATVAWGREHDDPAYATHGRAVLERLRGSAAVR